MYEPNSLAVGSFPMEVWNIIANFLEDPKDIIRFSKVCRDFFSIIKYKFEFSRLNEQKILGGKSDLYLTSCYLHSVFSNMDIFANLEKEQGIQPYSREQLTVRRVTLLDTLLVQLKRTAIELSTHFFLKNPGVTDITMHAELEPEIYECAPLIWSPLSVLSVENRLAGFVDILTRCLQKIDLSPSSKVIIHVMACLIYSKNFINARNTDWFYARNTDVLFEEKLKRLMIPHAVFFMFNCEKDIYVFPYSQSSSNILLAQAHTTLLDNATIFRNNHIAYVLDDLVNKKQLNYSLKMANLRGLVINNLTLENYNFENADFREVRFNNCTLRNVNFAGAILDTAHFVSGALQNVNFTKATLQRARFSSLTLENVNFKNADMTKADIETQDPKIFYAAFGRKLKKYDRNFTITFDLPNTEYNNNNNNNNPYKKAKYE